MPKRKKKQNTSIKVPGWSPVILGYQYKMEYKPEHTSRVYLGHKEGWKTFRRGFSSRRLKDIRVQWFERNNRWAVFIRVPGSDRELYAEGTEKGIDRDVRHVLNDELRWARKQVAGLERIATHLKGQ